jgi:hypothetical protein
MNPRLLAYLHDARRLRAAEQWQGYMLLRMLIKTVYGHSALVTLDNMLLRRGE